jgi:hypothetical protein
MFVRKLDSWASGNSAVWSLSILLISILFLSLVLDQLRPPGGWIALEFPAWVEPAPQNLPENWSRSDRDAALFGLGLDYLYLLLYPLYLSLALRPGQPVVESATVAEAREPAVQSLRFTRRAAGCTGKCRAVFADQGQ